MELKRITEEFVRGIIFHEDDIEEILEAVDDDSLEYIRHDLFVTLENNGGDVYGELD